MSEPARIWVDAEDFLVAGIDEAGRGPLAGPVVAAAVILDPCKPIAGLADSKTIVERDRIRLAVEIRGLALACSVAWADAAEVDSLNILRATFLAMRRAVFGLAVPPQVLQIDGNQTPKFEPGPKLRKVNAIVGGDASVPCISAASILAKVARDDMMRSFDRLYPEYGFARHKGYATADHREQLRRHGPCDQHRRSFRPLRQC